MTRVWGPRNMLNANHFGHRRNGPLIIDLFWEHGDIEDQFRVEVEDKGLGSACSSTRRRGEKRSGPSTTPSELRPNLRNECAEEPMSSRTIRGLRR